MIIPAILEHDFEEVKNKISQLEEVATQIHIDIVDESFASVTTIMELLLSRSKNVTVIIL